MEVLKDGKKVIVSDYAKVPLDTGARNICWCRRRIRRLHYHWTRVRLLAFHCFVRLFTMLQETWVGLREKAFEKDGVRDEYLRAPKDVIESNADEDIEFEGKDQAYQMILWRNFFRRLDLREALKRAGNKLRQKQKYPTGFRLRIAKEAASDIF